MKYVILLTALLAGCLMSNDVQTEKQIYNNGDTMNVVLDTSEGVVIKKVRLFYSGFLHTDTVVVDTL